MKRSKLLLVSGIIGALYLIYLASYCSSTASAAEGAEAIGVGIGIALIMPHAVLTGIAVIFNWVGFALRVRWGALTAGILYAVSMLLMPLYFMFVLIEMILCFVAFAKMKKANVESDNWGRPGPDSCGQSGSDGWGRPE